VRMGGFGVFDRYEVEGTHSVFDLTALYMAKRST
jgi:hypothetical protein